MIQARVSIIGKDDAFILKDQTHKGLMEQIKKIYNVRKPAKLEIIAETTDLLPSGDIICTVKKVTEKVIGEVVISFFPKK